MTKRKNNRCIFLMYLYTQRDFDKEPLTNAAQPTIIFHLFVLFLYFWDTITNTYIMINIEPWNKNKKWIIKYNVFSSTLCYVDHFYSFRSTTNFVFVVFWLLWKWSLIKLDWTSALYVCLCLNNNEWNRD